MCTVAESPLKLRRCGSEGGLQGGVASLVPKGGARFIETRVDFIAAPDMEPGVSGAQNDSLAESSAHRSLGPTLVAQNTDAWAISAQRATGSSVVWEWESSASGAWYGFNRVTSHLLEDAAQQGQHALTTKHKGKELCRFDLKQNTELHLPSNTIRRIRRGSPRALLCPGAHQMTISSRTDGIYSTGW